MPEINTDGYLTVTIRVRTQYDELVVVVPYKDEEHVMDAMHIAQETVRLRLKEDSVIRF